MMTWPWTGSKGPTDINKDKGAQWIDLKIPEVMVHPQWIEMTFKVHHGEEDTHQKDREGCVPIITIEIDIRRMREEMKGQ